MTANQGGAGVGGQRLRNFEWGVMWGICDSRFYVNGLTATA